MLTKFTAHVAQNERRLHDVLEQRGDSMTYTNESICSGMLEDVRVVAAYMRQQIRPRIDSLIHPSPRELLVQAIFFRALCWMETLDRLDRVQDFQAVATCTRSMLESAVDGILIDHDVSEQLGDKMRDWAVSAKFKVSEDLVEFYKKKHQRVPEGQESLERYYKEKKESIAAIRTKHWGGDHKSRWTGHWLGRDCRTADELEPFSVPNHLGKSLAEFHANEVGRLNWLVHGSGVAILEQLPNSAFLLTCALGFYNSSKLAQLISAITMKALRLTEAHIDIDSETAKLKANRVLALFDRLKIEARQG